MASYTALRSAYIPFGDERLRIEDMDGDGVPETVREFYDEFYGITEVIIIDGDTIISEVYDDKGKLMARLIWDEETQQ